MRVVLLVLFSLLSFTVHAKDLSSRMGVGYANPFGLTEDLPSLAMRYYPNAEYGLQGTLGVDTEDDNSRFGFQAKIMKIIFKEDHMNFYTGAAAGLVTQEIAGDSDSGFDLSGIMGAEFFMAGLENLSFNFEAGVGVTSINDEVRFRTIGDHPFRAGLFFYF
jgi:hypothetical protein